MRKVVIALGLMLPLAVLLSSQLLSALISEVEVADETGDGSGSAVVSDESENRMCPTCGDLMKLCIETSEYKYVCRCGYYVLR